MNKKTSGPASELVHELQAPLSVLKARLEAGLQASWCRSECKELLQECLEEVNGMSQTVVDLLLLETADSGQLAFHPTRCDLTELVSTIVHQFEPLASSFGVEITAQVEATIEVDANEGQLRRALSNLVENAVKFTPRGGQVSIDASSQGHCVDIRVQDTGRGIPADALEHIFERFYRLDEARSREIAGAGLGLCIARALALANGATLDVESTVGKGSCFTLRFPVVDNSLP